MFGLSSGLIQGILMVLGPLVVAIIVWFKGYSSGKSTAAANQAEAQRALDTQARAAEAKNQFTEKEAYDNIQKVRSADSSSAINIWNQLGWGPKDGK